MMGMYCPMYMYMYISIVAQEVQWSGVGGGDVGVCMSSLTLLSQVGKGKSLSHILLWIDSTVGGL